jgi:glucose-1-phosphate thymidylyltransferase
LEITRPDETDRFRELLADGHQWGMNISYASQDQPRGIAEAPLIAADFLDDAPFALALGDNIFWGAAFDGCLDDALGSHRGGTVFVKQVENPERYGVLAFDETGQPGSIVEKPGDPQSAFAVTGLYFLDSSALSIARDLKPSARGEIEITDINNAYLAAGRLSVAQLPDDVTWMDMGTPQGLLEASQLVEAEQRRQNVRIGVPEEVAFRNAWVGVGDLERIAATYGENDYGGYLRTLIKNG